MSMTIDHPSGPMRVDVKRRAAGLSRQLEDLVHTDLTTDLQRARKLANWLDANFNVGGFRLGYDTIIGLVPVVGDTITTLIGLYPLMIARRYKLGKWVQARMIANLAADWAVGLVPLAGDVLDAAVKCNLRNLALLEKAAAKKGIIA